MTSKIIVNTIEADTGISSVTFASNINLQNDSSVLVSSSGVRLGTGSTIAAPSANEITLSTNSAERLRLTSGGQVRIGNSTITASSSADDLIIGLDSPGGDRGVTIISGTSGTGNIFFSDTNTSGVGNRMGTITYDHSGNFMRFSTAGNNERFRIDSSGRLLVGTTSADSNTRLHVSAAENTSDPMATDASIVIANTQNVGNNEAAALKFNVGNTNTASISAHYDSFNAGVNSSLRFYTQYQSAFNSPVERLRIDSSGHVLPGANNTYDLGSTAKGWRNVYMNDLNLSNMNGDTNDVDGTQGSWTIQEGKDNLYIINRLNGKKFKIKMEEIS